MEESIRYLSDDQLKLVEYEIVFVKRGYEYVFVTTKSELVKKNIDECAFKGSKIAQFVLSMQANPVSVPESWKNYSGVGDDFKLRRLPDEDLVYLQVNYKVIWRHERETLKYHEDKLDEMRKQTALLDVISKK